MKLFCVYLRSIFFIIPVALADPISEPNSSLYYYDFVAKVVVRSIEYGTEFPYRKTESSSYYGIPFNVDVIEILHNTDQVEMEKLVVPTKSIINGINYDNPDWIEGKYIVSNKISIACNIYNSEMKWCVVEWILPDEIVEKYKQQKETRVLNPADTYEDQDSQERLSAARARAELRQRMEAGEISREDYFIS